MSTSKIEFSVPGHRSPAVGYEAPFEMLQACHERVQRMLTLLQRVRAYAREHGCDDQVTSALTDVMRYFDNAAPQHHLDEELHVFPVVLRQKDADLTDMVRRLQEDHRQMETLWSQVRVLFTSVLESPRGKPVFQIQDNALLDAFSELYERHIAHEEGRIYPMGLQSMRPANLLSMAQDMMRRRGVDQ